MPYQDRPPLPAGTRTLPAAAYTDPERFARELDRIHGRMWLCAGRAEELLSTGDYFLRRVGAARVIVVRGDGGRIHAFHDSCRHRGTTFVEEDCGAFAGRIQCPYHALDVRARRKAPERPPHAMVRRGSGSRTSRSGASQPGSGTGMSSSTLPRIRRPSRSTSPISPRVPALGMEELRRIERKVYDVAANWKLIVQNFSECIHCPFAHPQLQRYSHYLSGVNEPARPTYLGGRMELKPGVSTLSLSGDAERPPLPGLSAEHLRQIHFYAVLPNLLLSLHPDYMLTCTLWPRAVDRTEIRCEWPLPPGRDRAARVRSDGRDRVLGPDESPGLEALRARAGGDRVAGLRARALLEPGGAAPRARPHCGGEAPGRAGARRDMRSSRRRSFSARENLEVSSDEYAGMALSASS